MQCTDLKEGTLRQEKIHDLVGKRKMVNWGKKAYPAKILNVGMPAKGSVIASVLLIYHLINIDFNKDHLNQLLELHGRLQDRMTGTTSPSSSYSKPSSSKASTSKAASTSKPSTSKAASTSKPSTSKQSKLESSSKASTSKATSKPLSQADPAGM
jgi:hypothetical protein